MKKPVHTEDEQSTIEKTVKRFHNSSCSNGVSTERQSVEFRDPRTKQVFLRASMLETEQNLKRLSLIISESEEAVTQLRNPAELPPSSKANSSTNKSYEESDSRSKKTIAGQSIGTIESILNKMIQF